MKIKKKSGGGGANWMDTYGDMVTLLLCFFVLLYSMSTIDQQKFKALVQSFNPNAIPSQTEIEGNDGASADPESDLAPEDVEGDPTAEMTEAQVAEALDQLYEALQTYADESDSSQSIEVTKGDGYVFVSFNDAVFFDGESYELRPEGEAVLQSVAEILDHAVDYIDEVRVMGHTAQGSATQPNNVYRDRFLSASRAAIATVYIQEHCSLSPSRIVTVAYGQHRPVDSNDTAESRSHNRRVEISITGKDVENELGDSIAEYYSMRSGGESTEAPVAID